MAESRPDVLFVEDSDDDLWVARRAFQRHSLEGRLAFARTGEEALRYLRASTDPGDGRPARPCVIFLDLNLPGIHGHDVLREIRSDERLRWIPVVVVSSSSSESDINAAYRLGANSFVSKQYGQPQPGEYMVDIARYWMNFNQPAR